MPSRFPFNAILSTGLTCASRVTLFFFFLPLFMNVFSFCIVLFSISVASCCRYIIISGWICKRTEFFNSFLCLHRFVIRYAYHYVSVTKVNYKLLFAFRIQRERESILIVKNTEFDILMYLQVLNRPPRIMKKRFWREKNVYVCLCCLCV